MKYIFHGTVHPERADSGAIKNIKFETSLIENNKTLIITLNIEFSTIVVTVDDQDSGLDIWTLKNTVQTLSAFFVDAIGFENGAGYDVEIRGVILPDDTVQIFGVGLDDLKSKTESILKNFGIKAADIVHLSIGAPEGPSALANLREAIRMPESTSFFSFRAIEAIRQSFINYSDDPEEQVKNSWVAMGKALNIRKDFTKKLIEHATPNRHGATLSVTGSERVDFIFRAWTIIFRFLMLKKLSTQKLPENQFAFLDA